MTRHSLENPPPVVSANLLKTAVAGIRGEVVFDASLRDLTSLRIGGSADVLVFPEDVDDVCRLARQAHAVRLPLFVLGGTNVLIRDGGIRGIVVVLSKLHDIHDEEGGVVYAEGGVKMPVLLRHAVSRSLSGLEWAAGIPGTVGGMVVMNAGTHLGEMKDVVRAIRYVDPEGREFVCPASSLSFAYRRADIPPGIIVGAWIQLTAGTHKKIDQAAKSYLRYRKDTQPLTRPNVGSVFKNPGAKSAGQLIEEAGLKGTRIGDAQVSEKHANFIINLGHARATDVVLLMKKIQHAVFARTGLTLEPEVTVVGEP